MILVDTSVWIDFLRSGNGTLRSLLEDGAVLGHPFVHGEIALGSLRDRAVVLRMLSRLPRAVVATDAEVVGMIDTHTLFGIGVGYIDVHLLAATLLTPDSRLWTGDKRLRQVAVRMGVAATLG